MSGEQNPFDRVVGPWESVMADTEALAANLRDADFEVIELHPGDVSVLRDERFGIEVLVPDDEFDRLESWVEEGARFDSYEVFRTVESEIVFVLVVLTDDATGRAVCVPAYYETSEMTGLRERATEEGVFVTYVRRLRRDRVITFTQDDPNLFFPE